MSNDRVMGGPGGHEDNAYQALREGQPEVAQVFAILALASAVNRFAEAQENANFGR
ncbi:hypothetical protein [Streptosporangium saharense]|uniref:Uncharacterized protein n=1 Tax=Streptosporangium saharense TaxID=1706840 RepID=A0A7W7VS76_9ACTN|nr:hypothetical protein [Streptosporangium saharense]MBB4920911.1 hypothetical protein [Streptosporangium saharense]